MTWAAWGPGAGEAREASKVVSFQVLVRSMTRSELSMRV